MSSTFDHVKPILSIFTTPAPNDTENPILHLEKQFHLGLPPWLFAALSILALVAALITLLSPIFSPAKSIVHFVIRMITRRRPADLKRARRRAQFADHMESQLRRLSEKEEWRDDRFTELEAEVEIEGRQRRTGLLRIVPSRSEALRRVKSLSSALERSTERLIILQGEPGSGKSVALRHVGQRLAQLAMRKPSEKSIIPLYLNLREFRPTKHPVDDNEIRKFVFQSLNRANNRDVERFLDEEFDRGMSEGTWLFLLDSFDEIPEVLSAVEVDPVVEEYADALYAFLRGWNRSRGIIASREFRGPRRFGWPKFTIVRLSARQKADLISRADLPQQGEEDLIGGLSDADPTIVQLSDNPLFLGLLCEYIRDGNSFPQNTHVVFESYITTRLQRDAELVSKRFGITPDEIRAVAEEVAFNMAATKNLGLEATRDEIHDSLRASGRSLEKIDVALNAMEYIKLARSNEDSERTGRRGFTFAHRRFQEYFATCVVLREPERVSLNALLTDGRWRETAVTILQTQREEIIEKMLSDAEELLTALALQAASTNENNSDPVESPFQWPPGSLHLLGLLNAGMGKRSAQMPPTLRSIAARLLKKAWQSGRRHDRKWAVEVVSVAGPELAVKILELSFESKSTLLRQVAYAQAGRLEKVPENLSLNMRKALVGLSCGGRLRKERIAVRAQLKRLADPVEFLRGAAFLTAAPVVDFLLIFTSIFIMAIGDGTPVLYSTPIALLSAGVVNTSFYAFRAGPSYASAPSLAPAGQAFARIISASIGTSDTVFSALQSIGHMARLLFFQFGLIFVILSAIESGIGIAGGALYLYALSWSISGLYLFVNGRSTAVWLWPLFPFSLGRIAVRRGLYRLSDFMPDGGFLDFARQVGIYSLFPAGVAGLIFLQLRWPIVGFVWAFIGGAVGVSVVGFFTVRGVRALAHRHTDYRLLKRKLASRDTLSMDAFLELLMSIRTDDGLRALVVALRRGQYVYSSDIVVFLSDLGALAEQSLRGLGFIGSDANVSPQIQFWLQQSKLKDKSLRPTDISNDTLDEIARLVEAQSNSPG